MMKIGIIGAMAVEVAALKEKLQNARTERAANMEFSEGRLGETEVVLVQSGVGKVNAALCVQLLVDRFHVTHVLNTGVAGSLNNDINIGDIVVSADALYHDVDAAVFGYQPGELPQMGILAFPADETLRSLAAASCRNAAPDIQVFEGRIASGDQFISSREKKNWIREMFHADCTEMEGAAIAQAAWLNHIPFVIIRAISDKADESVAVSYDEFEAKAAVHCAQLVEQLITSL